MASVALVTHEGAAHISAYVNAIRDLDSISDVCIVDEDGAVFDEAHEIIGDKITATYRSFNEMLRNQDPLMAIVTASARRAPPLIQAALEAGTHVLAEKPACVNPDDFSALTDLADKKQVHLMLALGNRSAPWAQDARRIYQQRGIGDLYAVRTMTLADQTRIWNPAGRNWTFNKSDSGGGHLIWLGIHQLDLILYITGEQVAEVQAMAPVVGGASIDVEDLAMVNLRMTSGAHASIVSGYLLNQGYQIDTTFWGSQGWLRHGAADRSELEWHGTDPTMNENPNRKFHYDKLTAGYTQWVRETVRAALGEIPPPITGAEGLEVLRVIFAAYESARTGQTITL